jgi:polar amino acid transport system substrate-binding protein
MDKKIVAELAPTGALRAGINISNFLLVTGKSASGDPEGVAPDMARAVADRLGVPLKLVPYASPGELADMVDKDAWDVGFIGAEPQRAQHIAFTAAYCEIESTYLVPPASKLKTVAEVDSPGVRIAVSDRSAYELWLSRNIKHAELRKVQGIGPSFELFVREKLDALAGLKPALLEAQAKLPGSRVLEGRFTAVQQAVGTSRRNKAAPKFLAAFVEEAKSSGLVARLIARHKVVGRLSVAPPG